MGEAIITRRNFGGSKLGDTVFATINVSYPAGSVCTIVNGSNIFTASDTSGTASFTLTEAGTWTVSCTNGSKSKSKSVSITTEGQSVSVLLAYEYDLVTNGVAVQTFTKSGSGTSGKTGNYLYVKSTNDYAYYYCPTAIDLTNYTTLTVTGYKKITQNGDETLANDKSNDIGIYVGTSGTTRSATKALNASEGTVTLDISSLKGNYYVGIYAQFDQQAHDAYHVTEWYGWAYAKNIKLS